MLNQPHNFEGFAGDTRHQTVKAPQTPHHIYTLLHTFTPTDLTFLNLVERGVTYEEYARGGFDDD